MKNSFKLTGMTCQNCVSSVESAIKELPGVSEVSADLNSQTLHIESDNPLAATTIQKALPSKYRIETAGSTASASTEKWKALQPLFLILFYLFTASALLNLEVFELRSYMLDFMGLFLIVFSFFKFLDYRGFPASFARYDPLARAVPFYGWVYPFLETALGLLFLFRLHLEYAIPVTLLILGLTTLGVVRSLMKKDKIECACLGTVLKLPMTEATLIENLIMILMGVTMLF